VFVGVLFPKFYWPKKENILAHLLPLNVSIRRASRERKNPWKMKSMFCEGLGFLLKDIIVLECYSRDVLMMEKSICKMPMTLMHFTYG